MNCARLLDRLAVGAVPWCLRCCAVNLILS